MPNYKFSVKPLEDGWADIHITMPNPQAAPSDLSGLAARKRLVRFFLASSAGIASMFGLDLQEVLYGLAGVAEQTFDLETQRDLVIDVVRRGNCSPRDLEDSPPSPLSSKEARITMQELVDEGVLTLDDRLCLMVAK